MYNIFIPMGLPTMDSIASYINLYIYKYHIYIYV
jgi:hypothetical protein